MKSYSLRVEDGQARLQLGDAPLPEPGPGQVLLKMHAASLNRGEFIPGGLVKAGPAKPAGANANFVQTVPGKGWFAYFRLYGPTEPYFAKTWQLNDITPIQP